MENDNKTLKKPLILRETNGMGFGLSLQLKEEFKALAKEDGCETMDEFNKILTKGRLLDRVLRKGAIVIVYYRGKEKNIEDLFEPILREMNKSNPTRPVV